MRHSVVWAANSVEPDSQGEWVKYEELAESEKARKDLAAQLATLTKTHTELAKKGAAECESRDSTIVRQAQVIKAAQERLQLHGHTPNCNSRLGVIDPDGSERVKACNCGLDQWMRESGVG